MFQLLQLMNCWRNFNIFWNLSNLPPGCHYLLSSIYLALLCKSDDLRTFGYERVLQSLLRDLAILESEGIFIAQLGDCVKGTIQCVIADNLGAHGLAGFIEFFRCLHVPLLCGTKV